MVATAKIRAAMICASCAVAGTFACSSNSSGGSTNDGTGAAPSGGSPGSGGLPGVASGGGPSNGGAIGASGATSSGGSPSGGASSGGTSSGGVSSGGLTSSGGAPSGTGGQSTGGTPSTTTCAAPPSDATADDVTALTTVNQLRLAAGSGCATMISAIDKSAQSHCDYYSQNTGMCTADAHTEVQGCTGFTGASFANRMQTAGYTGRPSSEVMAFDDDPVRAIDQWVDSVWHRLPILDPWTTELGYGNATKCDTIDFGAGTQAPNTTVVAYPYDGETGLATSFDGTHEGPVPPAPATGWPSGYPITVFAKNIAVTAHTLTVDGSATPIDHVWLTSTDSNFLAHAVEMYANAPLTSMTKYHVNITGTYAGGTLNLDWTFTTR